MSSFLQHVIFGCRLSGSPQSFTWLSSWCWRWGSAPTLPFLALSMLFRYISCRSVGPDRLIMIWEKNPTLGALVGDRAPSVYTNLAEWVQQARGFEGIAGFEDVSLNRTGTGEPERIAGARVSPNFQRVGSHSRGGKQIRLRGEGPDTEPRGDLEQRILEEPLRLGPRVLGKTLTLLVLGPRLLFQRQMYASLPRRNRSGCPRLSAGRLPLPTWCAATIPLSAGKVN
jgi:hypothetical protein